MTQDVIIEREPAGDGSWMQRRLRVVARRRVRVAVDAIDPTARIVSDGDLVVALETVRVRDPRILAWRANREVDLVVVHDGCGARVSAPAVRLAGSSCRVPSDADAFLAFCYDTDPGPEPVGAP